HHILASVLSGTGKSKLDEKLPKRSLGIGIGRELDEGGAAKEGGRRWIEELHMRLAPLRRARIGLRLGLAIEPRTRPFLDEEKGAHAVIRGLARRRRAKIIVEDFERDRPAITGREDRREEAGDVQVS